MKYINTVLFVFSAAICFAQTPLKIANSTDTVYHYNADFAEFAKTHFFANPLTGGAVGLLGFQGDSIVLIDTAQLGGGGGGGTSDHGSLTGLLDDDHTQYALLAGRVTQTLAGGTGVNGQLSFKPNTANASSAAYIRLLYGNDGANTALHMRGSDGRIGLFQTSPSAELDLVGDFELNGSLNFEAGGSFTTGQAQAYFDATNGLIFTGQNGSATNGDSGANRDFSMATGAGLLGIVLYSNRQLSLPAYGSGTFEDTDNVALITTDIDGNIQELDYLTASATLDFASTSANAVTDLTISLTGAVDGDIVDLGVPNGAAGSGSYFAFVSSTNTVTVRFHNDGAGAYDPASGTFTVRIIK